MANCWFLDIFNYVFLQCDTCYLFANALVLSICPSCGSCLPFRGAIGFISNDGQVSHELTALVPSKEQSVASSSRHRTALDAVMTTRHTQRPQKTFSTKSSLSTSLITIPCTAFYSYSTGRKSFYCRWPSIFLSNVRSIVNKIDECHAAIHAFGYDIAVFVETWLNPGVPDSAISLSLRLPPILEQHRCKQRCM